MAKKLPLRLRDRIMEFFESDQGSLSMSRLLVFCSWIIASFVMVMLSVCDKMSEGYLTIYLGGFVLNYLGGKGIDRKSATEGKT